MYFQPIESSFCRCGIRSSLGAPFSRAVLSVSISTHIESHGTGGGALLPLPLLPPADEVDGPEAAAVRGVAGSSDGSAAVGAVDKDDEEEPAPPWFWKRSVTMASISGASRQPL